MTSKETRKIQQKVLSIYKEVKKICDEEKIHYYAISGTALGAIRHKGFIPWDDDIDLAIPINEFEEFKSACKKYLPKNLEFKELSWAGGKVHDKNTTFLETTCISDEDDGYGFFVDIFPLIGTPNNQQQREAFLSEMQKFNNAALLFDRYPNVSEFTPQEIKKWKNKLLYAYDIKESDYLVEFSFGYYYTFDRSGIENPLEIPFEDTTIPIASSYDDDLRRHYGDYMQLPPKEKRIPHNKYALIDFDTPYTKYYANFTKTKPELLNFLYLKHDLEGIFFQQLNYSQTENQTLRKEILKLQENEQKAIADYSEILAKYNSLKKNPVKFLLKKLLAKLR